MPAALTAGATAFRGAASALEAAHVRGLKLAILSDYDPVEKLRYLGLNHLPWAARLAAEQFGALKPHPRAFLGLAAALALQQIASSFVHGLPRLDAVSLGAAPIALAIVVLIAAVPPLRRALAVSPTIALRAE